MLLRKLLCFYCILILGFACDPPIVPGPPDPRASLIMNSNWKWYSDDVVDISNGPFTYIRRIFPDSCSEKLAFKKYQSFTDDYYCPHDSTFQFGGWSWQKGDSLRTSVPSDSIQLNYRYFFRFTTDTLQFLYIFRLPGDSLNGRPLRFLRTFLPY